jgi:hypothetical protein
VFLVLLGCSEPTTPADTSSPGPGLKKGGGITPQCLPGCTESDPNPDLPGYYLTSAVTDVTCFDGEGTDTDLDGLPNRCEVDLAAAFAPQLAISGVDPTGREPHWAARPYPSSKIVRIAYLLSYYIDAGPTVSVCNNGFAWLITSKCVGHNGDSEMIVLDVYYDRSSKHWLLDCATYSRHESWGLFCRGANKYPTQLQYPVKLGGYPKAYVSYQKHANYHNEKACDSGAILGTDTCFPSRYERVAAGGNVNIGSRPHPSQDCMFASNSFYSTNGVSECYWTTKDFTGWQIGNTHADPYSPKLTEFQF